MPVVQKEDPGHPYPRLQLASSPLAPWTRRCCCDSEQERHVGRRPIEEAENCVGKDTGLLVALREVRLRVMYVCSGRLSVVGFLEASLGFVK